MPQNKYPVSQLASTIKQILAESFKGEYWVFGELNGYKSRSGHVYPSICQRDASGNIIAKISLCIFRTTHQNILSKLNDPDSGFTMEDGLEVCFRLKPEFYPPYGTISGIVSDIDPLHTVEAAKRRRLEILRKLTDEGIIENNKRLPLPPIITRIGLITASKSAAERDFLNELEQSGYAFTVHTAYATMQGLKTEQSILKAINKLIDINPNIDIICITRGGGDKTDLQWFDNEAIARRILAADTPILCGIGHETDRCIIDDIARESHKTPTALAASFVERIDSFLHILQLHRGTLHEYCSRHFTEQKERIMHTPQELQSALQLHLNTSNTRLTHTSTRLKSIWETRARSHYITLRSSLAAAASSFSNRATGIRQLLRSSIQHLAVVRRRFPPLRQTLLTDTDGLKRGSVKILNAIDLSSQLKQIQLKWKFALSTENGRISQAAAILRQADPERMLQRGYSITTMADGTPVSPGIQTGDRIKTRTHTKIITSTITEAIDA